MFDPPPCAAVLRRHDASGVVGHPGQDRDVEAVRRPCLCRLGEAGLRGTDLGREVMGDQEYAQRSLACWFGHRSYLDAAYAMWANFTVVS